MNYINVEHASLSFGEKVLFTDVNLLINKGDRIALIAKNGSGKTTFLKLMAGEISAEGEKANILVRKNLNIAYLKQEPNFHPDMTVIDTLMDSDVPEIRAIRDYEIALSDGNPDKINACVSRIEDLKAWDIEARVKEILFRLNIDMLEKQIKFLSGGQRRRIALAQILIKEPDVLILDEPTNHLDVEMIEWLEQYLASPNLTIFMVTHDRYFLERVCNVIVELDEGNSFHYRGNYSNFLEKRAERKENDSIRGEKVKKLFKKELDWVRRQPKARGTKAKSRIEQFEKIKAEKNSITREAVMKFHIVPERLGSKIVEFHNVSKAFDEKQIMRNFSYKFKKNERVGISGINGSGKSTFINLMTGSLAPDEGKIILGETVKFGYYNQEGLKLDIDKRVIDIVRDIAEYIPLEKGLKLSAEQLLERFLFPRPQQQVFFSQLSGGERRRLYLLSILMSNPNFLILDEPTNDLDIVTLNILEDYLQEFPGCLVIISHDRYFMDKLTDHIFIMEGQGKVQDFNGSYSEWKARKELSIEESRESSVSSDSFKVQKSKKHPAQLVKNEITTIEKKLAKKEDKKKELTEELNSNLEDLDKLTKLSAEIGVIVQEIERLEVEWESWVEKLED